MLSHWKHLTLEQRVEIAHGLTHVEALKSIAERIGLDPASVSKEIRRNRTQETDGSGECKRLGRFPFVCDGCPRKYGRSRCGCAKFRYVAKAAQAMADKPFVHRPQEPFLLQSRDGRRDVRDDDDGDAGRAKERIDTRAQPRVAFRKRAEAARGTPHALV